MEYLDWFDVFRLVLPIGLLILGYLAGTAADKKHLQSLDERESSLRSLIKTTVGSLPDTRPIAESGMVSGNVVVSLDYFKRLMSYIQGIFGGRLTFHMPLLERARREALVRMQEQAVAEGYDAVVNVRLDAARIASSASNGKGTAGVEIFAYGTGIRHS